MSDWQGKRYWLVGASEGLGAALAAKLSRVGVELILSARSEEKLRAVQADLPGKSTVIPVDITDADALTEAAEKIGAVDGVIHMAGVYWPFDAKDWDADTALTTAEVNYLGAIKLVNAVLPGMVARDQGHLVFTGSLSGFRGLPASAPYTSSKAAVMTLAESLRADLWRSGVKVQLINPGFIKTRLTDKNSFDMPFIMTPEAAADAYFEHLDSGGFDRSFPRVFSWVFRLGRFLPNWLYYRLFA